MTVNKLDKPKTLDLTNLIAQNFVQILVLNFVKACIDTYYTETSNNFH